MAEVKQSESQEVPPAAPLSEPAAPVPTSSTATASSDLTPEELEMLQQFCKAKREESPTNTHNTDLEMQGFLEALAAKDVELSVLDFGLQQELRASAQARQDFLALHLTAPDTFHYDPEHGKFQKPGLSTNRLPWIGNEPDFKSFTFEDWPLSHILFYYIDPRIDDGFPIPRPVKTKFKLPNFDKDQIDYINSVYSINDRLLTDHLFTCPWYADNIDNYTRYQHKLILDQWKISFIANPDINPDRIINIPWDSLVATSALIALDSIDPDHIDYFPENLNDGFMDEILLPLSHHERNFYYIAAQIAEFIHSSPIYMDIYFGMDTFTSNSLQSLSAVCTCFTDVAYWQFAHVFHRSPRDNSQLQIPHDSLNFLWTEIANVIHGPRRSCPYPMGSH
eukprot:s822_g27.t1